MFLVFNGLILIFGERLRRRRVKSGVTQLSFRQAITVGTSRVLALVPGISRSGVTVVGGLASGLGAEMEGRFSFLLATPIILAVGVLELPKLGTPRILGIAVFGGLVAAIAAYAASAALMSLFRDVETLGPFGYYCIAAGIISALLLWIS